MSKQYYRRPKTSIKIPETDVIKKTEIIDGEEVQVHILDPQYLYKVRVIHSSLRKRSGPSIDAAIVGIISDNGEYYIYHEQDGWGQLDDGNWIMLQYTKQIHEDDK